jgi:hypothetical protein
MLGTATGRTDSRRRSNRGRSPQNNRKQEKNRPVAASVAIAPPSFLSIPTIPNSIPRTYEINSGYPYLSRVALQLLNNGVITEAEAEDNLSLTDIVSKSFNRWCLDKTKELTCFMPKILVSDTIDGIGVYDCDKVELYKDIDIDINCEILALSITYHENNAYTLKDKCDIIHKKAPELAELAIDRLYTALYIMFAVTPELAYYAGEMFYWCDDDAEEEPFLTEEDFFSKIPKWVAGPDSKIIDLNQYLNHKDNQVKELAQYLATWEDPDSPNPMMPQFPDQNCLDGCTTIQPGAWISWDKDSMFDRIMDDWGDYHYQGNTTDLSAYYIAPVTREGISSLLEKLEYYFDRLLWADRLLKLIGTERTSIDNE